MAVTRSATQTYQLDETVLTHHVRAVLAADPLYRRVQVTKDPYQTLITAVIRPGIPFMLSTDLSIDLVEHDDGTEVRVTTESQAWIIGDVFGFYDRYIMDVFKMLQRSVGLAPTHTTSPHYYSPLSTGTSGVTLGYLVFTTVFLFAFLLYVEHLGSGLNYLSPIGWVFLVILVISLIMLASKIVDLFRRR